MQHIFIVNPAAGKSDASHLIKKQVEELFEKGKIDGTYKIEISKNNHDVIDIAKRYAQSNEEVILYACGGDGTLNDVVNGAMNHDNVTITQIPLGTGNDFIKFFGKKAKKDFLDLNKLVNGDITEIDVIDVEGHYSLNIANVGLDAMIANNVIKFKKLPFVSGKLAYKISVIYSFLTSLKHHMEIVIDGEKLPFKYYTFAVFANAKYYGGNYCAAPRANIQDGLLEVVLIPNISRLKILKFMSVYENGEHLDPKYKDIVYYHKARSVQILKDNNVIVCLDGEMVHLKNPQIKIAENKIKFLVPVNYDINGKIK